MVMLVCLKMLEQELIVYLMLTETKVIQKLTQGLCRFYPNDTDYGCQVYWKLKKTCKLLKTCFDCELKENKL